MRRRIRDVYRKNKAVWPHRVDIVIVLSSSGALRQNAVLLTPVAHRVCCIAALEASYSALAADLLTWARKYTEPAPRQPRCAARAVARAPPLAYPGARASQPACGACRRTHFAQARQRRDQAARVCDWEAARGKCCSRRCRQAGRPRSAQPDGQRAIVTARLGQRRSSGVRRRPSLRRPSSSSSVITRAGHRHAKKHSTSPSEALQRASHGPAPPCRRMRQGVRSLRSRAQGRVHKAAAGAAMRSRARSRGWLRPPPSCWRPDVAQ